MWYRMMTVAFFTNGLGAFGVRVLQDMGLAETHAFLYLAIWYTAGFILALAAFLTNRSRMLGREVLIGGLMGLCSAVGWFFLTMAIARGLPGYLVYPIAIGGSLSIVAAVGVLVFKERLSPCGYAGIASGVAAVVLLTI